jgi:hypothetical protein
MPVALSNTAEPGPVTVICASVGPSASSSRYEPRSSLTVASS